MQKYEIKGIVGEGAYGIVYQAKVKETGEIGKNRYRNARATEDYTCGAWLSYLLLFVASFAESRGQLLGASSKYVPYSKDKLTFIVCSCNQEIQRVRRRRDSEKDHAERSQDAQESQTGEHRHSS